MNKIFLIGNLTRDPETSVTAGNVTYSRFAIAVNRPYKDKNGETATDFIDIIAWRGTAEACHKYLSKGKKVAVVGSLETRQYEDNEGKKRVVSEVIAEQVEFLSPRVSDGTGEPAAKKTMRGSKPIYDDEDLPF